MSDDPVVNDFEHTDWSYGPHRFDGIAECEECGHVWPCETVRREYAYAHRGEVVEGEATPVTPRRLDSVFSMRVTPELAARLRVRAAESDLAASDLMRIGAEMVLAASDDVIRRAMQCPSCDGSGVRKRGSW